MSRQYEQSSQIKKQLFNSYLGREYYCAILARNNLIGEQVLKLSANNLSEPKAKKEIKNQQRG